MLGPNCVTSMGSCYALTQFRPVSPSAAADTVSGRLLQWAPLSGHSTQKEARKKRAAPGTAARQKRKRRCWPGKIKERTTLPPLARRKKLKRFKRLSNFHRFSLVRAVKRPPFKWIPVTRRSRDGNWLSSSTSRSHLNEKETSAESGNSVEPTTVRRTRVTHNIRLVDAPGRMARQTPRATQ
jgi:hypothetical protein